MPTDLQLTERLRKTLRRRRGIEERRMFGGTAFLLNGHMCCGVNKDNLVLRLGNEGAEAALREPHTRPMDFTGKPLRSMVYVGPQGYESDADLRAWVDRAVKFARSLPPK